MECVLPEWLGWVLTTAAMVVGGAVGLWTASYMSGVGKRRHHGDFHGQRLYDAAGTALGVLAFALITMMLVSQLRVFFCA